MFAKNCFKSDIAIDLGTAHALILAREKGTVLDEPSVMAIRHEGVPRSFTISPNEILEALTELLNNIVSAVKTVLAQIPPERGADIAERGMTLPGGGVLLRDLDRVLAEETGLPVLVAEGPMTAVVRGLRHGLGETH